ncbi:hypothetical protein SGLAM104S_05833 [Streptomyces glaucescens]
MTVALLALAAIPPFQLSSPRRPSAPPSLAGRLLPASGPPGLAALVARICAPARVRDAAVAAPPSAARVPSGWISVAGLAAATLMLLPLLDGDRATFCLTGDPAVCSYTADRLVLQLLVLGGALVLALLSVTGVKDARGGSPKGILVPAAVLCTAGAALLPASRDLATLIAPGGRLPARVRPRRPAAGRPAGPPKRR